MRITLNLATRPFVELRPYLLRLRFVMAGLVVLAVGVAIATHVLEKRLNTAKAQMSRLQQQTSMFQSEQAANERRMREPQNAQVLDRAHFLNALFLRKSFSWTAVMMDLERVLPGGVLVTSIEPQVNADGSVVIRLRVAGERDRAVQLVRNLEGSARFLRPRLSSETQQSKQGTPQQQAALGPAGVEFEILADYNPLPEGEPYPKARAAAGDAGTAAARRSPRAQTPPVRSGRTGRDGLVLPPYGAPGSPYNNRPQASSRPQASNRPQARGGTR
jgi:type IV pilus assembly protein PilN